MTGVKALRELAALDATGALHVEAALGAVIYLQDGAVTHIDAEAAPGIGAVLTASGRLSTDVWDSVLTVGGPTGRVAALLVEQGYLSQGELELCVNGALFDAAYFALAAAPRSVRFVAGERSWFGGSLRVDVERLVREVAHRRELLTGAFPSSEFDDAPLALVPRLPRDQIVVDAVRWELLLNADGRRTPLELARQLGRAGFATLLEVRRLAAAGLLLAPSATETAPKKALPKRPTTAGGPNGASRAAAPVTPAAPVAPAPPESAPPGGASAPGDVEQIQSLPPLPRRLAGGRPARVVRPSQQGRAGQDAPDAGGGDGPRWPSPPPEVLAEPPSLSSLRRVRDALQEFS